MATTTIQLDRDIVEKALKYATVEGQTLSSLIENYLLCLMTKGKREEAEKEYPDIVRSLLGAGSPVGDDDINGRKAYHQYLKEKYQ